MLAAAEVTNVAVVGYWGDGGDVHLRVFEVKVVLPCPSVCCNHWRNSLGQYNITWNLELNKLTFTQRIVFFHLLVGERKSSERGGLNLHHRKGDTSCRRGQKEVATLPSSSREEGIAHRTVTVKKREKSICLLLASLPIPSKREQRRVVPSSNCCYCCQLVVNRKNEKQIAGIPYMPASSPFSPSFPLLHRWWQHWWEQPVPQCPRSWSTCVPATCPVESPALLVTKNFSLVQHNIDERKHTRCHHAVTNGQPNWFASLRGDIPPSTRHTSIGIIMIRRPEPSEERYTLEWPRCDNLKAKYAGDQDKLGDEGFHGGRRTKFVCWTCVNPHDVL